MLTISEKDFEKSNGGIRFLCGIRKKIKKQNESVTYSPATGRPIKATQAAYIKFKGAHGINYAVARSIEDVEKILNNQDFGTKISIDPIFLDKIIDKETKKKVDFSAFNRTKILTIQNRTKRMKGVELEDSKNTPDFVPLFDEQAANQAEKMEIMQ